MDQVCEDIAFDTQLRSHAVKYDWLRNVPILWEADLAVHAANGHFVRNSVIAAFSANVCSGSKLPLRPRPVYRSRAYPPTVKQQWRKIAAAKAVEYVDAGRNDMDTFAGEIGCEPAAAKKLVEAEIARRARDQDQEEEDEKPARDQTYLDAAPRFYEAAFEWCIDSDVALLAEGLGSLSRRRDLADQLEEIAQALRAFDPDDDIEDEDLSPDDILAEVRAGRM